MGRGVSVFLVGAVSSFIAFRLFKEWTAYPPLKEGQKVRHDFVPESYREGRKNFRDAVGRLPNAELVTLVVSEEDDLTIDIGVIPGNQDKLLLHLSGVHGPEGHAGSGIQAAILHELKQLKSASAWPKDFPTLVLVHAVNPYGFSTGRRWNENNVDLNRNVLSKQKFKEFIERGPPTPYVEILKNDILNSRPLSGWFDANVYFYALTGKALLFWGYNAVKHALVAGQYHFKKGIFYGGQELQDSWVLLKKFLHERNYLQMQELILLDAHTGLGPPGKDTLLIKRGADLIKQTGYLSEDEWGRGVNSANFDGAVAEGYQDTHGTAENILDWFPQRKLEIALTQEFGTVNSIEVLRALILDWHAWKYATNDEQRRKAYERTRGVFFIRKEGWKQSVVDRGVRVFGQLLRFWNHEIPSLLR